MAEPAPLPLSLARPNRLARKGPAEGSRFRLGGALEIKGAAQPEALDSATAANTERGIRSLSSELAEAVGARRGRCQPAPAAAEYSLPVRASSTANDDKFAPFITAKGRVRLSRDGFACERVAAEILRGCGACGSLASPSRHAWMRPLHFRLASSDNSNNKAHFAGSPTNKRFSSPLPSLAQINKPKWRRRQNR